MEITGLLAPILVLAACLGGGTILGWLAAHLLLHATRSRANASHASDRPRSLTR